MAKQYGFYMDTERCIKCWACEVACKNENGIALGEYWNRVLQIGPHGIFPDLEQYWLPVQCQQCEDAPCVHVCPTGASYRDADGKVLVEQAVPGFEVGCAVIGTRELLVGEIDEIELSGGFFDFTEKYTLKTSAIHVPARVDPQTAQAVKQTAKVLYRALGCAGFARVDLFLTPQGKIVFNEINTIPGFTEHSRFPGMMQAAGMTFPEILDTILGQVMAP